MAATLALLLLLAACGEGNAPEESAGIGADVNADDPGGAATPDAAARAVARLHALDRRGDTQVWPGHDPVFWATRRRPPAAYA